MRVFAAGLTLFFLLFGCSTLSRAKDITGFNTWLGPTADDMAKDYNSGTFFPKMKDYGWFGPNQQQMSDDYRQAAPGQRGRGYQQLNRRPDSSPFPAWK
ncbi:MAG: hypothetical protein V1816_13810 [Pseudomonadota bacterium]